MKKILEFQTKLDNSQFDKDVEQMQRKLKEIYSPSDQIRQQVIMNQRMGQMGLPGQPGAPTMAAYKQATQVADQNFRKEVMAEVGALEQKKKLLADHAAQMQKTRTAYEASVKAGKEDLQLQQRITAEMKNHADLQAEIEAKTKSINAGMKEYLDRQPKGPGGQLMESFSKGGTSGLIKKGVEMAGGAEGLLLMGVAGAAVFALKTAVNVAENFAREFGSMRRQTATAQASAIQGSAGAYLGSAYAGRSVFETGYAGERASALQRAMEEDKLTRGVESMKAGLMPGQESHGFGTMLPMGVNTGAAQVGVGGLLSLFGGDTQRARFLGSLGFSGYQKKYEALKAQEMISNYQENLQAEQNKDPLKQLAMQHYEGTYGRDLGVQRRLGLSDSGLYGQNAKGFSSADRFAERGRGFYEDVNNAGFLTEQGIGMMGDIMSAGGSTRMGRGATSALQFQRGMNLDNAGSLLGQLSGNMGDAGRSKNALIEILAEGTRLGLNKSEFAEEQRKFAEATASVISRGYGGNEIDQQRMSELFGSGVASKTTAGIGAAAQAMDFYSQTSATATGAEGALGFASMLGDPTLQKLGAVDMQSLNAMKTEDVTSDNPRIIAMASKAGVSPEDIVRAKNKADRNKMIRSGNAQSRMEALGQKGTAMGFGGMDIADIRAKATAGDKGAQDFINEFGSLQSIISNQSGINDQKVLDSHTMRLLGMGTGGDNTGAKGGIVDALTAATGRTGDVVTGARAKDEGMVNDKTRAMLGDFNRMAEVSKSMSTDMVNAMLKIQAIIKDIDNVKSDDVRARLYKSVTEAQQEFARAADGVRPSAAGSQPQSGKK